MLKRGKKYQAITQHNYEKIPKFSSNLSLSYNDIFVVHTYDITNNKNKNEK